MSGIVGVICHDPAASVSIAEIDGLLGAYEAIRGTGRRHHLRTGDRARVVKLETHPGDDQPVRQGDSWLAFSGSLHHPAPIQAPVDELEGQFALVRHDATTGEVSVASDPFGMQAFYAAERGGKTYLSTSALALASHLRCRPSLIGLHGFLLAGYQFGTMTHWEGVRRLDPATLLSFTETGLEETTYWRPSVDRTAAGLTFTESVDHCVEAITAAFRAHLSALGPVWVDLTGGYDSRLLAIVLRHLGIDFCAHTRETPSQEDESIAERIAGASNLAWTKMCYPTDWPEMLPRMLPVSLAWGDANLEVLQLSRILWAHEQLGRSCSRLLSGGGGEHLQYAGWKSEFTRAGKSTTVNFDNWVSMRLLGPVETSIFAADPVPEVKADFSERMMSWREPYADELNTTQLDILFAYKSTGHFGAYRSSDSGYVSSQLPFYLKPVFTAAFSTNYRFRNGHRLMRHMIDRLDPKVAAITTTKGGPAQPLRPSNAYRFAPYLAQIGRKAVAKTLTGYPGASFLSGEPTHPWTAEANGLVIDAMRGDGTLEYRRMRSASLYNPRALDRFLIRARRGGSADSSLLGRIITVELALRATDCSVD